MKTIIKLFVITLLITVLIAVLGLGYLGFIPGVSALMGTNKPRNLGIRHTEKDLSSAQTKLGQTIVEPQANPYQQYKFAQGHPVDIALTQEEYSAHVERIHPVADMQIKFTGSSFEMSGRVVRSRIPQFIRTWGVADVSDAEVLNVVSKYFPTDPIFYLAGSGSAKSNVLTLNLTKAELGRLPIPTDRAKELIELYTETLFSQVPGFSVEESTIQDGQLHFKGSAVKELPKY